MPARRHAKKLTESEKQTGWRYQLIVTNIEDLGRGVPGSHGVYFVALSTVTTLRSKTTYVRAEKATGLRSLPFHGYARNQAWVLAADLSAYLQALGLEEHRELAAAEPATQGMTTPEGSRLVRRCI